jgi:hypothetical protein
LRQAASIVHDERFNHLNFHNQPYWLVKQLLASYQSAINQSQMSQARANMMTANINRAEGHPGYEDISVFLPYPSQFLIDSTQLDIHVSPSVAKEFLDSYEKYPAEVETAFTKWIPMLRAIIAKQ